MRMPAHSAANLVWGLRVKAVTSVRLAGVVDWWAGGRHLPDNFAQAPTPSTPETLNRNQGNGLDWIGRHVERRHVGLDGETALLAERGLSDGTSYLKSDRMLWLFWLAIDSACTPSCC
jgi:hypothetical protein